MSKMILIPLTFVVGIIFSIAYPEPAFAINEAITPIVDGIKTFVTDFVRSLI